MIKSSLKPVSTLQWKIFLSDQIIFFVYVWTKQISPIFITLRWFFNEYINCFQVMLGWFIHKLSRPVQWYFSRLQIKMNGNQPFDWLGDVWIYGWPTNTASVGEKKLAKCSEGASMKTWWTRGGNQAQSKKKTSLDSNYL